MTIRASATSSPTATPDTREDLTARSLEALNSLSSLVERTSEPAQLEELLYLNDEITYLLGRLNQSPPDLKKLKGLGIELDERTNGASVANGHPSPLHLVLDKVDEEELLTPRTDKGKQRAEPEPEEPQLVLTPTVERPEFEDSEQEQDLEASVLENAESIVSPTDRYVPP